MNEVKTHKSGLRSASDPFVPCYITPSMRSVPGFVGLLQKKKAIRLPSTGLRFSQSFV